MMDVKLESLIEQIKKDGIEEAQRAKQEIIDEAKAQASDILEAANKEAANLLAKAKEDTEKLKNNTESSLRQAARDMVLSLRQQIGLLFEKVFKDQIDITLEPEFTAKLITSLIQGWAAQGQESLEVLVSKDDQKKISQFVLDALKKENTEKIEIRAVPSVSKGFMIGFKNRDLMYDFTDESILESLKAFLTPTAKVFLDEGK
jgi:V/A-type H+/Na+-transporting ATPase subunit E